MFTADSILNIIESLPDHKMNPVDDNFTCIYNDFDGNRCIAGEVLFQLGLELPKPGSPENGEDVAEMLRKMDNIYLFSAEAIDILCAAQFYADKYTHDMQPSFSIFEETSEMGDSWPWELAKIEAVNRYNEIKESF